VIGNYNSMWHEAPVTTYISVSVVLTTGLTYNWTTIFSCLLAHWLHYCQISQLLDWWAKWTWSINTPQLWNQILEMVWYFGLVYCHLTVLSTHRLYHATGVWNTSRRARRYDKHTIEQWNNTI